MNQPNNKAAEEEFKATIRATLHLLAKMSD
jgi:hypothetical protein